VGGPLTSTHRRLAHHDLHLVSFHMPSVKNNDSTISFHFISRMPPGLHFISFHFMGS
jgi:lactate dehydrogenase-like 2-hydroxyacid dehydrogenase